MSLLDALMDRRTGIATESRIFGLVVGVVTNNQDPDGLGRVKLRFPWLSEEEESFWARIAVPMAGNDRGMYFLPEVDDEVLVGFDRGDLRFPFVIGALWNGQDSPPADNSDGNNNIRIIKSRSGHIIKLNDEDGSETIEIIDKTGSNSIVINSAENTVTITTDADISLAAASGTIKLDAQNIEINSSADTKITAGAGMDIEASGTLNAKGATVNIN